MKNRFIGLSHAVVMSLLLLSCIRGNSAKETDSMNIKIGNREWMKQNLSVSVFRNGESIPCVMNIYDWNVADSLGKPAYCYYEFDSLNGEKYGKIYNIHAVSSKYGLAPEGWHVSTSDDWLDAINTLKDKPAAKMKSKTAWKDGGDDSGFSALPGGKLGEFVFSGLGQRTGWWVLSEQNPEEIGAVIFKEGSDFPDDAVVVPAPGYYVRCVKNVVK